MDYSGLKQAILNYTDRPQLADNTGTFIELAEAFLRKKVYSQEVKTIELSTENGEDGIALPSDYGLLACEPYYSFQGSELSLSLLPSSQMNDQYNSNNGYVSHYNIIGNNIMFYPNISAKVKLRYYTKLPALSQDNPTNFLLADNPDIYIYASLIQANIFIDDKIGQVKYENLLAKSLIHYNAEQTNRVLSSNSPLTSQYTV